jgi:phage tail sheath protein FI
MPTGGAPVFGLQFIQVDDQPQPVVGANLDVIGIIGPSSTADPEIFPENTPVLVFSNDLQLLSHLGADGYIPDAINGINAQLADFEIAAQLVIVRTPYGTSMVSNAMKLQQTIANIMGNSVLGTGVYAFLKAPNSLYCTPRIIVAPGYTGQMANSLDTLHIAEPGVGYLPGQRYDMQFTLGNGEQNLTTAVLPQAHAVADSNGHIGDNELFIDTWGAWFTVAPTATLPAPDGEAAPASTASGQIIFNAQPGVGSSVTISSQPVTFVAHASTPGAHEVNLGINLSETVDNLVAYLMGSTAQADPNLTLCTYQKVVSTYISMIVTSKAMAQAANSITLATNVVGAILPPTLSGGADAEVLTQATVATTMALGANPICANLTGVLDTLIGHAIVESSGSSMIADENWRTTLNSQRLIGLSGGVKIQDPTSGDIIVMPLAPRMAGAMVAEDFRTGYPFHSCANRAIQGIVGPARTIAFSLTDGATEGQMLLGANLGIVVRGLIGVESAISSGGFILIATDNMGDDELWRMYNVKRGRDYIHLSLMPALRTYLGRTNIDRQTVTNVEETIALFLGQLTALQQILGYKVTFQGSLNSASEIRLGHLTVSFAAEEPPVLKRITTMSARYKPAIDAMVAQLAEQLVFSG